MGLCTLSSLNDRRCKYTLTLCQAGDHPGDTHKLSVCERERLTARTRVERSEKLKVKDTLRSGGGEEEKDSKEEIFKAALNVFVLFFTYV